jgi:hypothetical protein
LVDPKRRGDLSGIDVMSTRFLTPPYSRNTATNELVWRWHEQWRKYNEAKETGKLTKKALRQMGQQVVDEANRMIGILMEENAQGLLTRAGAKEVAIFLNKNGLEELLHPAPNVTIGFSASGNRVKRMRLKSKHREEFDAEKFATAIMLMAEQKLGRDGGPTGYSTTEDVKALKRYQAEAHPRDND